MSGCRILRSITTFILLILMGSFCQAAPISITTARQVASNILLHHLALFGDWAGYRDPCILDSEPVEYQGREIAYNFTIFPSGHVLVAADDDMEPVLLYSATSSFDSSRAYDQRSIESVILSEFSNVLTSTKKYFSQRAKAIRNLQPDIRIERIKKAWDYFLNGPQKKMAFFTTRHTNLARSSAIILGLPLSSIWEQTYPYNLYTPADDCMAASIPWRPIILLWGAWLWPGGRFFIIGDGRSKAEGAILIHG